MLKWPRGKYNGKRIVGFKISIKIDILFWMLTCKWNFGEPYLFIGPVCIRFYAAFELQKVITHA